MKKQLTLALLLLVLLSGCASNTIEGGPVNNSGIKDGIYKGSASQGPVHVIAEVTVADTKITRINLLKHRTWKGKPAHKIIPERIIEEQSTDVDGVSGATMSSVAIMNAVEDAVKKSIQSDQ